MSNCRMQWHLILFLRMMEKPVENLAKLLEMIRKPLALYALWLGADEFGVSISSQGIQVIETPTHKTAPQYRVQNLKENWISRANTALDLVLKFLDEHRRITRPISARMQTCSSGIPLSSTVRWIYARADGFS